MAAFASSSGLTLQSLQSQSFRRLSSHFLNHHIQVNAVPYAITFPSLHFSKPFKLNQERFKPVSCSAAPAVESPNVSFRSKNPSDINILVVGSTGYIGRFVATELVKRGFNVIAIARERSGIRGRNSKEDTLQQLSGANVCFSDVTELSTLEKSVENLGVPIDVVVSCLASRNGGVKDSWKIDYEATKNSLVVGRKFGAAHFVLLSAICVQKPLLEFQRAKLKFEADLMKEAEDDKGFTYSIVRPTAFFKSLAGQVELVKDGKPYVMFGDGKLCACKPISEEDLASFISDCVLSEDKMNQVLPIGGPGKALTPLEQGEMLFKLVGKEPKFIKVPIQIMDFAIGFLDLLVKVFPSLEDAAEFGKIGRYYAAESMLVWDPEKGEYDAENTPSYGKDTLEEFFKRVLREGMGGQELGEQMIF
ncbi:divinyl chlorophyllide a 8-vinyl-reductase, chloroplastic [Ipomoea triloba]|uniref:divinyl chlorophyllide a 8-vinyl-reductase, chloroplastic n=1 Tax=Ipomoea triloba TaxID=35885 RepID=UPI00125E935F|nr:divinyl chlorophyllide a 8-vinyl-reductase, chloroplastic [Ipomoea triloba]GMD60650.1 Divinyl chlorophyllide A 8-vinyl-reductase, chloroplastic [Ipomoea batatas]